MKPINGRVFPVLLVLMLAGTGWVSAAQIEARAGFFLPASKDFREIYKNGLTFGVDITLPLSKSLCAWAGLDYFGREGKLSYTQEPTTLRITPLFVGIKLQGVQRLVNPYAAVAAGYFLYKETNAIGTASGGEFGVLAQTGLLIKLKGRVFLDIHGRYSSSRYNSGGTDPFTADLGGFQGGLGLAVRI
jgi:hypothetical protein